MQLPVGKEPFDYISVTPPYTQVDYAVVMDQISNSALVGENTFIVSHGYLFVLCAYVFFFIFYFLISTISWSR